MSQYVFKLPDLGEGTVEAEIVSWKVKPGDTVAEDDVVAEVMTEKAAVEVPAPVSGRAASAESLASREAAPLAGPLDGDGECCEIPSAQVGNALCCWCVR